VPCRVLILSALLFLSTGAFATDLTVGWISRSPEIDYVWNSSNPKVEGWPAPGSTVTWRANVRSWFDEPKSIAYSWKLGNQEIARGTVTLAPNAYTPVDLPRPWSFTRERLSISIDTANAVGEQSEVNNSLEVFTDALSVGFWVEQSFYEHFRANQHRLGIGSTSFENWAQRMIDSWNDMSAMAVFPETPSGVHDRWRLQKIVIVPDNALPLVPPVVPQRGEGPPGAVTQPDSSDRSVDLQWGFRTSGAASYNDFTRVTPSNPFYVNGPVLHEIAHARYLTDVYAFDLRHVPPENVVSIAELAPNGYVFYTPEQGLMNRNYTFLDRFSAAALNLIAGRRAVSGNYNEPENIGEFLNDLPSQNRLTIRDAEGNLMANADVELFLSEPFKVEAWYASDYDDVPDVKLRTDANGQVLVGRNPFSLTGPVLKDWGAANVIAIVKAGGKWGFLESRIFNLAYWRGEMSFADHELVVGRTRQCGNRGPSIQSPAWDSTSATSTLRWSSLTGAVRYNVYAASPSSPRPRLVGSTTSTQLSATFNGRTYWWVEAVFADSCPPLRSDSSRVDAPVTPSKGKRRAVR
jgi:hypothetical protein